MLLDFVERASKSEIVIPFVGYVTQIIHIHLQVRHKIVIPFVGYG